MYCHDALHNFLCNTHVMLSSQRLYRSVYEKNKMKIHIVPDMVEMVTAKDSQKKVSEIDYRLHLHEWICHPDLKVNSHVRKVTDQISDVSPLLIKFPAPRLHTLTLKRSTLTYFFTSAFFQHCFPIYPWFEWNSELSLKAGLCVPMETLAPSASLQSALCFSCHRIILGPEGVHVFGVKVTVQFQFSDSLHLLQSSRLCTRMTSTG